MTNNEFLLPIMIIIAATVIPIIGYYINRRLGTYLFIIVGILAVILQVYTVTFLNRTPIVWQENILLFTPLITLIGIVGGFISNKFDKKIRIEKNIPLDIPGKIIFYFLILLTLIWAYYLFGGWLGFLIGGMIWGT